MRVVETLAVSGDVGTDRVRAVYESDHARLWRSLYAFTSSRSIADDAAAEAFAQALRRGDEIRDVQAWVWRAAYAIARGELKRGRSNSALPEVWIDDQYEQTRRRALWNQGEAASIAELSGVKPGHLRPVD